MPTVEETVNTLAGAWEEFKRTNDERLRQIETKGTADGLLDEKLTKLNTELDLQGRQIKTIAAERGRLPQHVPGATKAYSSPEDEAHAKAYTNWMRRGDRAETELAEAQAKAVKTMSVGSDPDGGYIVPVDTSGRIVQRIFETSELRPYANIETIGTDQLEGPLDTDQTGAGWVGETTPRTNTNTPKIGLWSIKVHELYCQPALTQKLLDDAAYDVDNWLTNKISDKFTRTENTAFVTGNGVNQPTGFLSYATVTQDDINRAKWNTIQRVNTGTNGAFAAAPNGGDVLINVISKMKQVYRKGAIFAMTRTTVGSTRTLKDSYGQYLWRPGLELGQADRLLGYDIAEFADMPEIGNGTLSIAFANFKEAYTIVDRIGIRTLRDPYTSKPLVLFYTTKRVGGDVTNFDAIKLIQFS